MSDDLYAAMTAVLEMSAQARAGVATDPGDARPDPGAGASVDAVPAPDQWSGDPAPEPWWPEAPAPWWPEPENEPAEAPMGGPEIDAWAPVSEPLWSPMPAGDAPRAPGDLWFSDPMSAPADGLPAPQPPDLLLPPLPAGGAPDPREELADADVDFGSPPPPADELADADADVDFGPPPPPADDPEVDASAVALQEAGFASPLHSALGELRRINDGSEPATTTLGGRGHPVPPAVPAPLLGPRPASRRPEWLSVGAARGVWADRWREWTPGLVVAALVVLAFAVVLASGGRHRSASNVDAGPATTVAAPSTTLETGTSPFTVPPVIELPADATAGPSEPGARHPTTGSAGRSSPAGGGTSTPPKTSPKPARGAPAPASPGGGPAPKPAPQPAHDGSPGVTVPPTTTPGPPTTVATTPTTTPDPCNHLPPDKQDLCPGR